MTKVFLLILLAILVNGDEILDHGYPEKNDGVVAKTRIQTISYLPKKSYFCCEIHGSKSDQFPIFIIQDWLDCKTVKSILSEEKKEVNWKKRRSYTQNKMFT